MTVEKKEAYLKELVEVGRRHGLTLSHEDFQGGFLVEGPSEYNERWLLDAVYEPGEKLNADGETGRSGERGG